MPKLQKSKDLKLGPKNSTLIDRFFNKWQSRNSKIFEFLILFAISVIAFSIRLFSVISYESIIHEFDPWFNYRVTKHIHQNGFLAFFKWFDEKAWYPTGREIYNTTYFGMMFTSVIIHRFLQFLRVEIHIREVCVFLGPLMSILTCNVVFFIARGAWDSTAGLISAAFVAVVPGYLSRSVAGSYDYECIAIFTMTLSFLMWMKAFETGRKGWAVLCGLSYFYMVSVWGGYLFVLNLIAVHVCAMIVLRMYNQKVYSAYTIYYIIGTLLTKLVPMVSKNYFGRNTHIPAFGVFILLQLLKLYEMALKYIGEKRRKHILIAIVSLVTLSGLILVSNFNMNLTGRLYHILGINHGIHLVNSIAEHQSTSLRNLKNNLPLILYLVPLGVLFTLPKMTPRRMFLLLYLFFSTIFTLRMVRVILVLAPVACIFAAIACSALLNLTFINKKRSGGFLRVVRAVYMLLMIALGVVFYYKFLSICVMISRYNFSHPTVILRYADRQGNYQYVDDYREGYLWLKHNTPKDSKVLSWWDYGYQITGFSDRTVYVDNNTRDNKRIAWVGKVLGSTEEAAYKELVREKVDYLLVVFGGKVNYNSDDVAKAYWIIKIASGYHSEIKELKNFRIDKYGEDGFKKSLLFKMCYYRFDEVHGGYDSARKQRLEGEKISLKYLEEAYTTENWILRIYRVKKPSEINDE